jgi:alkylation response protein AidB-like acyl-CoA dehydrogenase
MTPAEQEAAIDAAKELAIEFDKVGLQADQENALQLSLVPLYKDAGLVDLCVPKKYGGKGGDIWTASQVSRELAKGDASSALAFNMHQTMVGIFRGLLDEDAAGRWFPQISAEKLIVCGPFSEDRAGLIGLADTIAKPDGAGGWVISGQKTWGTLSEASDIIAFNATIVDDDGVLPEDHMAHAMAEAVFLARMDTPGISIKRTWDSMGMRGTGTQTVVFDNVEVGADAMGGNFRGGLFGQFEWAAMTFSGVYLGAQLKAFEATREILRKKSLGATMEGKDVQLKGLGYVQSALGRMFVLCRQSELVLQQVCEQFIEDDFAPWSSSFPQRFGALEVAKLTATENAIEVVDLGIRAVGGSAYRRGHVLERLYRDVRSGPFHPLTTDQIYDHAGRYELGLMDAPAQEPVPA